MWQAGTVTAHQKLGMVHNHSCSFCSSLLDFLRSLCVLTEWCVQLSGMALKSTWNVMS